MFVLALWYMILEVDVLSGPVVSALGVQRYCAILEAACIGSTHIHVLGLPVREI
jgi:hypothetical protein